MKTKKYCSPGSGDSLSCVPHPILKKIAHILNKQKECKRIKISSHPKQLYKRIKEEVKHISDCNKETCWLEIKQFKNELSKKDYEELKNSFRPLKPKSWNQNPNEWLTTENIDDVMEQYQNVNPTFEYLGALPIDFDRKNKDDSCAVSDLCQLNLQELIDGGTESVGIVFNVDPSTRGGLHWFSIYVDLVGKNCKTPCIYYFDSVKGDILLEIERLIQTIKDQYVEIYPDKDIDVKFNDLQHQYEDTECGVYCIHFLTEMLKGRNFFDYVNSKTNDKMMNKFRNVFFV